MALDLTITDDMRKASGAIGSTLCYNYKFVPLRITAAELEVAALAEFQGDEDARIAIRAHARRAPRLAQTWSEEKIYAALRQLFASNAAEFSNDDESEDDEDVRSRIDAILEEYVKGHATDLHVIERRDGKSELLVRTDRALDDIDEVVTEEFARRAINAIRRKANIRDDDPLGFGAFEIKGSDGRTVQCRVQILPDDQGKDAILRFNGSALRLYELDELGMDEDTLENYKNALNSPGKIHAIVGPMNSGKTTTRASVIVYCLTIIGGRHRAKAVTGEDPVEIRIEGATQVPINEKKGLSYAAFVRALVRSDADIVGIGEVRDDDTADAAVGLGYAGRTVVLSMHAMDSIAAVGRFLYFNVAPEQLDEVLGTVLSQRMLPIICQGCRVKRLVTSNEVRRLTLVVPSRADIPKEVYDEGPGCDACAHRSRIGQVPVFELFVITRQVGALIRAGASYARLREEALRSQMGYKPMLLTALQLVSEGRTSLSHLFQEVYNA